MSDDFSKFYKGTHHRPQAADPSNPEEGDVFFSNGTPRAKGFWKWQDGIWQVLGGSGGGGLDVFYKEDHEVNGVSKYTDGNNATVDGGGTLDGVLDLETSTPIAGTQSARYTMGSSSTDDYILGENVSLDEKQQNKEIAFTTYYKYDGDDADIKAFLYDVTNAEIIPGTDTTLDAKANSTSLTIQAFIKGSIDDVKIGFQVLVGNNTKILLFDDIEATTNPLVFKDIINVVDWVDTGETVSANIDAITTAPTFGTLPVDSIFYTRQGALGRFRYELEQTSAGTAGSGNYLYSLPLGLSFGADVIKFSGTLSNTVDGDFGKNAYDGGWFTVTTTTAYKIAIVPYDNTQFRLMLTNYSTSGTNGSAFSNFTVGVSISFDFEVPILGWTSGTEHILSNSVLGANFTQWTPALVGVGTPSAVNAYWKRSADKLVAFGTFTAGTVTAVEFQIPLPDGVAISSKVTSVTLAGRFIISAATTTDRMAIMTGGDTFINLSLEGVDNPFNPSTGTAGIPSGNSVSFQFEVPIEGWDIENSVSVLSPNTRTAYIKDVKAVNTAGGTFTSGADRTRDLNDLSGDTSFILSLIANQFILSEGTYLIEAEAPAYLVQGHKAKLRNITDSTDDIIGSSAFCNSVDNVTNTSNIIGTIIISSSKTFEIQHRCLLTAATAGFGKEANLVISEVYTQVKITKIK